MPNPSSTVRIRIASGVDMDAMIAVMNRVFAIEQAIETAALMLGTTPEATAWK